MQEGGLSHSLHKLEFCINDLKDWFKLMLNTNKTGFIVFTSRGNQVKVNMEECVMHIGGDIIKPSKCVRDLGSYLDSNLSMDSNINMAIRSVYGHLRSTGKISKSSWMLTLVQGHQLSADFGPGLQQCFVVWCPREESTQIADHLESSCKDSG